MGRKLANRKYFLSNFQENKGPKVNFAKNKCHIHPDNKRKRKGGQASFKKLEEMMKRM